MTPSPPAQLVIGDLELFVVELECRGLESPLRSMLLRLAADTGQEGWGECVCIWRPSELEARRGSLLGTLSGRSVFDLEEMLALEAVSMPSLRCAVEMASWDLIGRALGQPLCNLLGGRYRRRVPMAARLPELPAARASQLARELVERGFHTQIASSSGDVEADARLVSALRQATGDGTRLQLDAGSRYDDRSARDLCAELEYAGLQFIIDPLNTSELYPLAALARQTGVPMAVRRAIRGPSDVLAAIRCGAGPAAVLDMGPLGGLTGLRNGAAVADAAGLETMQGGTAWLGVGTAAMLQLAAALPALRHPAECSYYQMQDDVLASPLEIVDGMMNVPQGPGLGVEVDRAKVEKHQVA